MVDIVVMEPKRIKHKNIVKYHHKLNVNKYTQVTCS